VVTWNVARRTERLAGEAMVIAEREPDIVALKEIT
jgi:hypothetical protein